MGSRDYRAIAIAATAFCIIALAAVLAYTVMTQPSGYSVYFDRSSDLPDSVAALKHGTVGEKEALNVMEVGRDYRVAFTVMADSAGPERYRYVMEYGLRRQEESFSLGPSENRTFEVTITPTEDDKWTFQRNETSHSRSVLELPRDAWLGERVDYSVVAGEPRKAYDYAPMKVTVGGGFGDVLNLNVTLDELRAKPYSQRHSSSSRDADSYVASESTVNLSVTWGRLIAESMSIRSIYSSKPALLTVTVYRESADGSLPGQLMKSAVYNATVYDAYRESKPPTVGFWYQIK